MISWQGPPTLTERFAGLFDILWRAFAVATLMFLTVCFLNVGMMAIWEEEAQIILYPLFVFWIWVLVGTVQGVGSAWPEIRLRLGIEAGVTFTLMAPLIWVSLIHWQWPVLRSQIQLAQAIGDAFR